MTLVSGEPCVMTAGTSEMLQWCADSWDVVWPRVPQGRPTLARAVARACMVLNAQALRVCYHSVKSVDLAAVHIAMMQVWYAQVNSIFNHPSQLII